MQALAEVLSNYLQTKTVLEGKAEKSLTPDHRSVLEGLPQLFESILKQKSRRNEFLIKGSVGSGILARVPWVGIFNRTVTTSAQRGYYIVLLFSEDMSSCYLSLNQGVMAFEKMYSRKLAFEKIQSTAMWATSFIKVPENAISGRIDLKASGHLGQGYELGAIVSYRYSATSLPTEDQLAQDFSILLELYDRLISTIGHTLEIFVSVNEDQFQQATLEKAATGQHTSLAPDSDKPGGDPVPPKRKRGLSRYTRNPTIAAHAILHARFKCEVDNSHTTFISSSKGLPYIEAHHLIPMSEQDKFQVSIDVAANIIALCPHCHKLLHHGRASEKRSVLVKLFEKRKERLYLKEIEISSQQLISFYSNDVLTDET